MNYRGLMDFKIQKLELQNDMDFKDKMVNVLQQEN